MSGQEISPDAPVPRLCHLVKWADFDGYGFNLHAEKARSGQFIGKVDEDSPAQHAGLREGDRIIEVNGVNIANENHRQVVERIKSIPNETKLLVVDEEADKWYKEKKLVVKSSQANVLCIKTPVPRPVAEHVAVQWTSATTEKYSEPPSYENISVNGAVENGSNTAVGNGVSAKKSSPVAESPKSMGIKTNGTTNHSNHTEKVDHAEIKVLKHQQEEEEKVAHKQEIQKEQSPKKNKETSPHVRTKEENTSRSSTPMDGSVGSIPDSPHSSKSSRSSVGAHSLGNSSQNGGTSSPELNGTVGLNLNMSASEMRQMLASRKKKDPKKVPMDIRQKFEIIQQM